MIESLHSRAVQGLLHEWAQWSRLDSGEVGGYPSRTAFDRERGSTVRSAMISDLAAEVVDRAVAKLQIGHPTQAKVIKLYYLKCVSDANIGRVIRDDNKRPLGREGAITMRRQAEARIEDLLATYDETPIPAKVVDF